MNEASERMAAEKAYQNIFTGDLGAGFHNFLRGWMERAQSDDLTPMLDELSDAQRMKLFARYCSHCGCIDPHAQCQCWNDE